MIAGPPTDGRRARGDATRRTAARKAAEIATTHGLDAITVGALATATGLSKSGILTVFPNREAIQVAAVAEARRIYRETVIAPTWDREPGEPRLRALVDSWIAYLKAGVFPGGCFVSATSVEYGHRDGPVADAVRRLKREWLQLLEAEFTAAGSANPAATAFKFDALLTAGNVRRELFGDDSELDTARDLALEVLRYDTR
ncbi:TetR/AcrR family transcriptional regulator [Nocardia huaxiensis]|uniref:TetR/AcrR family transcriptional regulator n=1 Tax=Nocardia huaxiensis TaxID=2755382 RepID=A0A7D6V7H9_9NOCA|nr:TetR/AcrR family transcriptional regulator [Nocardia huaxiensis]QLY28053.1 TetR/AcrR family transcriptional regulator [Nocardia huaxiensis]UFS98510.1 TetR/AcrR family transcriptional regulator [Nocardia huaxiensis]